MNLRRLFCEIWLPREIWVIWAIILNGLVERRPSWLKELEKNSPQIFFETVIISVIVAVIAVVLAVFLTRSVGTQMQIDLVVSRVTFEMVDNEIRLKSVDQSTGQKPSSSQEEILLKPIKFFAITLNKFSQVDFNPVEVTDHDGNHLMLNELPLRVLANSQQQWLPKLVMEVASPNTLAQLNELSIKNGTRITFAIEEGERNLAIEIKPKSSEEAVEPQALLASLHPNGSPFLVTMERVGIKGYPSNFKVVGWPKHQRQDRPFVQVQGRPDLKLTLVVPVDEDFDIFPRNEERAFISGLNFVWEKQREDGKRIKTTAVIKGEISYPTYLGIAPINFGEATVISLGEKNKFHVERVSFDHESRYIKLRLNGFAEDKVETYPETFPERKRDYRLAYSESLTAESKFFGLILNILIWLVPLIVGVVGIVSIVKVKPTP